MAPNDWLKKLVGTWQGPCRTWFEPGQLADESSVSGEFTEVFGGKFIRHQYRGSMLGKPRLGEEWLAFNAVTGLYQIAWIDDFHMNYAILFSQGGSTERGFEVLGEYDVAPEQPRWGWRTHFEWVDEDHWNITAFNRMPGGEEAKAVETLYVRIH